MSKSRTYPKEGFYLPSYCDSDRITVQLGLCQAYSESFGTTYQLKLLQLIPNYAHDISIIVDIFLNHELEYSARMSLHGIDIYVNKHIILDVYNQRVLLIVIDNTLYYNYDMLQTRFIRQKKKWKDFIDQLTVYYPRLLSKRTIEFRNFFYPRLKAPQAETMHELRQFTETMGALFIAENLGTLFVEISPETSQLAEEEIEEVPPLSVNNDPFAATDYDLVDAEDNDRDFYGDDDDYDDSEEEESEFDLIHRMLRQGDANDEIMEAVMNFRRGNYLEPESLAEDFEDYINQQREEHLATMNSALEQLGTTLEQLGAAPYTLSPQPYTVTTGTQTVQIDSSGTSSVYYSPDPHVYRHIVPSYVEPVSQTPEEITATINSSEMLTQDLKDELIYLVIGMPQSLMSEEVNAARVARMNEILVQMGENIFNNMQNVPPVGDPYATAYNLERNGQVSPEAQATAHRLVETNGTTDLTQEEIDAIDAFLNYTRP